MKKVFSILLVLMITVQSICSPYVNAMDFAVRKSLEISKTSVPPMIDGRIDESVWKRKVNVPVDSRYLGSGFNGTEAKFGMLWDNTYLYVAVDIKEKDADFVYNSNGNWAQQDNISMFFDPTTHRSSPYVSGDMELGFAYRPGNNPEVNFGSALNSHSGKDEKILRAINTYGNGWICEVAIPWDMLSFDPYLKKSLGFELNITDKDSNGSKMSQAWCAYGSDSFSGDTSGYGTIFLSDKVIDDNSPDNVMLKEDFEGYNIGDIPIGWISDSNTRSHSMVVGKPFRNGSGKRALVFDGSDSGKQARIISPVQWDNYIVEADVCFESVVDNNRWASIMFRVPADGKNPYNEMAIRRSGVWEISYRDANSNWSIPYLGSWNKGSLKLNRQYTMKLRVFDQNIKEYIKDKGVADFDLLIDQTLAYNISQRGKVGFQADQCKVAFDNIKVTRLSVRDINSNIASSVEISSDPLIPTFTADFSDGVTNEPISNEKVKLYSSDENVLKVVDGKLYPVSVGKSNIKIVYYNIEKDVEVNVFSSTNEIKPVSISHDKGYIFGTKNEINMSNIKFIEEMSDGTSRQITGDQCQWSFDKPEIAQWMDGQIQILETGTTTATLTKDGLFAKVLLLARKSAAEKFILYEENFDRLADGTIPDGWMRSEGAQASKIGVKSGAFEMDATYQDDPARVELPSYLADFGNYSIEADITSLALKSKESWNSLMYRIQDLDYSYYQMTVRKDATAQNGIEFAERTGAKGWNVIKTAFFTEDINESKAYHYTVKAFSNRIQQCLNNMQLINANSEDRYIKGGIGFQASMSKMRIDNVKITLLEEPMSTMVSNEDKYARVVEADTKIAMAPTVVSEINSQEDLDRIVSNGFAATAILTVNKNLEVLGNSSNNVIGTVSLMYEAMKSRVIPAFRVNDADSANAIAQYLKNNTIEDAFVISKTPELVKQAREIYVFTRGIIEFDNLSSNSDTNELMKIRNTVNSNLSRIAIIPADGATRYNVKYLQQRLITVWPKEKISYSLSDVKLAELHSIITAGSNGIVTDSPETARQALSLYNHDTTIIRKPFLIGHRGVPSLAPENTIEGCELAFQLGADAVENDIYPTKVGEDGYQHLVVMHDDMIDRTTTGSGSISDKTLEEVSAYFANKKFRIQYPNAKIPTLNQYFEKFSGKDQMIFVEIKSKDPITVDKYAELIRKTGYDSHLTTISFSKDQLIRTKDIMPEMSLGFLYIGAPNSLNGYEALRSALFRVQTLNANFMPVYSAVDKEFLEISKHRGMTIYPWTFKDKASIIKYFKMGVYSMTTNCVQVFSDWAAEITSKQSQLAIRSGESISLTADVKTYKGEIKEVAPEVVVLTGREKLEVDGNSITALKEGDAYVTLRYNAKLSEKNGDTYDIYTQPVKIQIQKGAMISDQRATPTATPTATPEATPTAETAAAFTPAPNANEPTHKIPSANSFKDIKGHWSEEYVTDLINEGVVSGYKDGTIKPNKLITREEFIKLLLTASGYAPSEKKYSSFDDNDKISKWALGYIIKASEIGIIEGYKNKVMPSKHVTRAEAVVMTMRAFGYDKSANKKPKLKDAKEIPEWAADYMYGAYEMDIIKGYNSYEIRPNRKLSRAEALTVIERCMEM
ncbi:MAG TPA: S-layer homology domain-containing protein [Pseudobacteroides sp.]|uniref:S-layer homology domain-containing protein n=1 Tax=Pseudobacteroides sp. TaxID=1968840 RepID=UPI002F934A8D